MGRQEQSRFLWGVRSLDISRTSGSFQFSGVADL